MKCGGDLAGQIRLARAAHGNEPANFITTAEVRAILGPDGVGNEIDYYEANQLRQLLENSQLGWEVNSRDLLMRNCRLMDEAQHRNAGWTAVGIGVVGGAIGLLVGEKVFSTILGFAAGLATGSLLGPPLANYFTTVEPVSE